MSTIKCSKCGSEIPAGSKFCMECGSKIEPTAHQETGEYRPRLMHYAYGNNQSCGGKSDIIVRNGFVYYIHKEENEIQIRVSPINDETLVQTLYLCKGPGCTAACLNMVEDELIFYEFADGHKITAIDIYSGERRIILEGHPVSAIWIENELLTFVENGNLRSIHRNGSEYYEYTLPWRLSDRIFGYGGKLYATAEETGEAVEIPYRSDSFRPMNFLSGGDMIYGIIGNLYYAPAKDPHGNVIYCKNIDTMEIINGIQDVHRLITAFEQYVIFSRTDETDFCFAWNVQTLRVYKLNRFVDLAPYSFTHILSDYVLMEHDGKLYKVPAPVFFQGEEPMFDTDKYLFAEI